MESYEAWQDQIDLYLKGQMNAVETSAFEAQLAADEELAGEVKLQAEILEGIEAFGDESFKKQLQAFHLAEFGSEKQAPKEAPVYSFRPKPWMYAIAASILLLVAVWLIWPGEETLSARDLYAANEPVPSLTMGNGELSEALRLMEEGQYDSAAVYFQRYAESHPEDREARLNAGIAWLKADAYVQSIAQFEQVQQIPGFYERATWLLALVYLKREAPGDLDRCWDTLEQLIAKSPNAQNPDVKRAKELLDSLRILQEK